MSAALHAVNVHHPSGILRGVQLTVRPGQRVAIRGVNGSGKTTLIKLCTGLWKIRRGTIQIFGAPVKHANARARLGYMPDRAILPAMTVANLFRSVATMRRCGVTPGLNTLQRLDGSDLLTQRADRLSLGQTRKVSFALSTMHQPDLLIADEPLANLDHDGVVAISALLDQLHQRQCALLYTCPNGAPLLGDESVYDLVDGQLQAAL
ncbi:MAG: zinc transport system ATP-binding protein [Kiritimatiellia bacterium]|jgi:zinc transport system ATP-binding protein